LVWALIIPLAILNGALREGVLVAAIGEGHARPVSGITLCLLIFIVALIFIPKLGKGTKKIYWKIGGLWVVLTVLFETLMGIISGNTFGEIAKNYDITTGNLWLLVVIFTGITPWLVAKLKKII